MDWEQIDELEDIELLNSWVIAEESRTQAFAKNLVTHIICTAFLSVRQKHIKALSLKERYRFRSRFGEAPVYEVMER